MAKDISLAISRDELVLLQHSEEGKDVKTYGNLYTAIKKYKRLSKYDVEFGEFDDIAKLALTKNKESLMRNISSEWSALKIEETAGSGRIVHCQLCGTKNQKIYYIVNNKNESEMNVGSLCIGKFTGIHNLAQVRKEFKDATKIREEIQRNNAFLTMCTNADKFVKKARKEFLEFPILLPWSIYEPLNNETNTLIEIYNTYKKKGDIKEIDSIVAKFNLHKEEYKKLWKKAKLTLDKTEDSIYVCKKPEYKWMIDYGYNDLFVKISKDGGKYTSDTIGEVFSHNFIKNLIPIIKECCKNTELELIEANYQGKELIFHLNTDAHRDYLEIKIPEKVFMRHLGWKCCFIKDNKIEITPQLFELTQSKHNIEVVITRLNRVLPRTEKLFKYNYIDDETGGLYIERGIDATYKPLSIKEFLRDYLSNMFRKESDLINIYLFKLNMLNKNSNWREIKDREESVNLKKLMAMGKKDKSISL